MAQQQGSRKTEPMRLDGKITGIREPYRHSSKVAP
jgi:hypothetical protein